MLGDHKTFRKIMSEIDILAGALIRGDDSRRLIRLVELFKDHLMLHSWGEETFFYPVVQSALEKKPAPPLTNAYMDHLDEEHKVVDRFLMQLEKEIRAVPIAPTWPETYRTFCRHLVAHMTKEEEEFFPLSEGLLGEEKLEKLSLELEKRRSEAPKVMPHSRI